MRLPTPFQPQFQPRSNPMPKGVPTLFQPPALPPPLYPPGLEAPFGGALNLKLAIVGGWDIHALALGEHVMGTYAARLR